MSDERAPATVMFNVQDHVDADYDKAHQITAELRTMYEIVALLSKLDKGGRYRVLGFVEQWDSGQCQRSAPHAQGGGR